MLHITLLNILLLAVAEGLSRGVEELAKEKEERPAGDRRGGSDVRVDVTLRAVNVHRNTMTGFCTRSRVNISKRAVGIFVIKRNVSELLKKCTTKSFFITLITLSVALYRAARAVLALIAHNVIRLLSYFLYRTYC